MTLELLPYQREGARFLAGKERGCLFDEMGVGKTAQAIAGLDLIFAEKVLIVCPAAARQVWVGEFKKFGRLPRKVAKGKDIQDLNLWLRGKCDVLILSFEMAAKWATHIEKARDIIDAVVVDEAHYLKNDQSKRTRALLGHNCTGEHGLFRWGAHVWFLTGTPAPNDAADIWTLMRFCRATPLERGLFRSRYFSAKVGAHSALHTPLAGMIHELKQVMRSCSLRRTADGVGLQLPPIWLTNITVDGDTSEVRALLREYPDLEEAIVEAIEKGGLSFLDAQHVATLRRLVGEAKAPAYLEMLKEEFDSGRGKTVIFGVHSAALTRIVSGLNAAGYPCVGGPGAVDARHVEAFQNDPAVKAIALNITAGGTAITLTSGSQLDMFESAWSPAANAQALKRVHRIGQRQNVSARFITLANSIDEVVNQVVERKTRNIAMIGAFNPIGAVA